MFVDNDKVLDFFDNDDNIGLWNYLQPYLIERAKRLIINPAVQDLDDIMQEFYFVFDKTCKCFNRDRSYFVFLFELLLRQNTPGILSKNNLVNVSYKYLMARDAEGNRRIETDKFEKYRQFFEKPPSTDDEIEGGTTIGECLLDDFDCQIEVENEDLVRKVKTEMKNIPERARIQIEMRYLEGKKNREIGDIFGCTDQAVQLNITNGLKKLKKLLKEKYGLI